MAPGYEDMEHFSAAVHHVNLGHGLGLKAMRSINNNLELGCVLNLSLVYPVQMILQTLREQNFMICIGIEFS